MTSCCPNETVPFLLSVCWTQIKRDNFNGILIHLADASSQFWNFGKGSLFVHLVFMAEFYFYFLSPLEPLRIYFYFLFRPNDS